MNIVHLNETQPIESHFSFFLSLYLKKNSKKTTNGASVLGISGKPSSATLAAATAPKRHRNATRRPQGQLRAIVGDHRREAVRPTSRGGGSGPGLLHRLEDPKSTRVPNPPGLRVPFRPLRRDRISSRLCSRRLLFIYFFLPINRSLLQDSVWLICCWVCVCAFQLIDLCCMIRFG